MIRITMVVVAGWSSPAWAVCEVGTPKQQLNCLVSQVNALTAELADTRADLDVALDSLASVETDLADLADSDLGPLLNYVSVDLATDSVMFTGANLYARSGSGATNAPVNGPANLIVGYSEDATFFRADEDPSVRTGSHNLVTGGGGSYTSFGGLVAGFLSKVTGNWASVSGGWGNTASGDTSSVTGGGPNEASG